MKMVIQTSFSICIAEKKTQRFFRALSYSFGSYFSLRVLVIFANSPNKDVCSTPFRDKKKSAPLLVLTLVQMLGYGSPVR